MIRPFPKKMPEAKAAARPMMPISKAKPMAICKAKERKAVGVSDDDAGGTTFLQRLIFLASARRRARIGRIW